ncbi:hypothetical protein PFLUV_G00188370 [Perca fluviatilis]|uniref:Uncharacterized protein n=1 Tax=Perca fluviatilis TaxID=8168 RepID=A0A6A5EBK0_PERFL|nr:hypothetical protein PFLUV_G00188370 [Perca fluviatilis]
MDQLSIHLRCALLPLKRNYCTYSFNEYCKLKMSGYCELPYYAVAPLPPTLYGIKTCNLGFILFTKTAKNTAERRRRAS